MNSFTYVTYIATTPETLWDALTSSAYTEKYFFGSKIESEWKVGARVTYYREGEVTDFGEILTYEPNHQLSYTWSYVHDQVSNREQPTTVTFKLKQYDSVVKLTVKHENLLPTDLVEEEDTFHGFNNGWPAIISNLKSLLETGKTLPPIHV